MNPAIKRIETILKSHYDTKSYVELVREIFPRVTMVAPDRFKKEFTNFSSHIEGAIHIGNYKTPDNKNIIIMAVQLKKAGYVENSRSTQRSYAKKLIENANADAAFVAFYTEGDQKWRLSFVRLDYEMKIENGRLKTEENLTPAKRYSYLVGENEPCHTAISRFDRFIVDTQLDPEHPTLDDLENAFSVEKVTDEFFKLYCEKFHQLREKLEENEDFRIEAERHNFTSSQFAKKLMGQIVFLYFLQKKGWLGVGAWPNTLSEKEYQNAFYARGAKSRELIPIVYRPVGDGTYRISANGLNSITDEDEAVLAMCVKGRPWGSGPHNFMRKLYEIAERKNQNFYEELLEPLFYEALNVNRGEQGYCPALHCRIPFLSGGLFEPIDGYEWKHNNFNIPNDVFSNADVKGRDADGILDIFDRYNFTMSEDEPMEREVAIDPEMLGKVFENLLEVNDRKSKGAFYTPREIVHYMCQESLIDYLTNTLQIKEESIREFILYGDFMKDEDTVKEKRQGNGGMYISETLYKLDSEGNVVVDRLKDIDEALKNVRVADPAVGSGAFPLGMLNEIVRARQNISAYMAITMKPYDVRMMYQMDRSPHNLKYETIKNCIFAADIEPSAVDIAQLRLWLSLVIDDEINPNAQSVLDGHKNPLPLPNLECNILCGNSLIDEFEGTRWIKESELFGDSTYQLDLNHSRFESIVQTLIEKQNELFRCDNTEKKKQLKDEIESLRDMVILSQLEGCDVDKIQRYQESKQRASKPYVLWQLDFARVFREKGGFDIVIGNPPYIQLQKEINEKTHEKLGDQYKKLAFESFTKTGDIYCLFYEKGYNLLHNHGTLCFITSNKWMRAGYGKSLRGFFAQKTNPLILIDFAGQKIFESATVDVNILMFSKDENKGNTLACIAKEECRNNLSAYVMQNKTVASFNDSEGWVILSAIEASIKTKIEAVGTPLCKWNISIKRGILTGYNDAFIVDRNTKDSLIATDPKSAELIRPILRGRDIKRYSFIDSNLYLLYIPWHFPLVDDENIVGASEIAEECFKSQYPAIYNHLLSHKESLSKRNQAETGIRYEWYALQRYGAKYMDDFNKQKIMYNDINQRLSFCLVPEGFYCNNTVYFIADTPYNKYLLAFLNSKLIDWYYKNLSVQLGEKAVRMFSIYVENIPIPKHEGDMFNQFEALVEHLLQTSSDKEYLEISDEIDDLVFKTYKLTDSEILFIKNMYT